MRHLLPALVLALVVPWAPVVVTSGAPAEARSASKIQSDLTGWTGEELADGMLQHSASRPGRCLHVRLPLLQPLLLLPSGQAGNCFVISVIRIVSLQSFF